jgi:chloramphenicol 3-O phosphotransferase
LSFLGGHVADGYALVQLRTVETMYSTTQSGKVVILNGAPRSGKSSIAAAIQDTFDEPWMNLGADLWVRGVTPPRYRPGIGLRPGGERPDLEPFVVSAFAALYDSIAAHCRRGLNVVADVGHHDAYSKPLGILQASAKQLDGFDVLFVGVKCPIEVIMARREASRAQGDDHYVIGSREEPFPAPVSRWQEEVHRPGVYDLEVDTAVLKPDDCAAEIRRRLRDGPPGDAFMRIARGLA